MKKASLAVAVALLAAVGMPSAAWGQTISFGGPTDFEAGGDSGLTFMTSASPTSTETETWILRSPPLGPESRSFSGAPGGTLAHPPRARPKLPFLLARR